MKTALKKEEKVVLTTKLHWFTIVGPFFIFMMGTAICSWVGYMYWQYAYFGIALFLIYLWYKIAERNRNIWVVTNQRVIDEWGVFTNNSKESPLEKINNVEYSQSFWGKMFGYGNVQIQTAAEIGATEYDKVTSPRVLQDTITRMQEEYKSNQVKNQAQELANAMVAAQKQQGKSDLATELDKIHSLKEKGAITQEEYDKLKAKLLNS